jgi:hypothetical protein
MTSLNHIRLLIRNIKIVAGQKYAYAEVVFQHYYKDKTWVNGKYVSDNIRTDISKTTSPSGYYGENGWDLQPHLPEF